MSDFTVVSDTNPLYAELDRLKRERDALADALQELTDICEHVPIFKLDDGKVSVKSVRRAGKFVGAMTKARAALAQVRK